MTGVEVLSATKNEDGNISSSFQFWSSVYLQVPLMEDVKDEMEETTGTFFSTRRNGSHVTLKYYHFYLKLPLYSLYTQQVFQTLTPWTYCRILLKDEANFVLDAFGDSGFKGSLKQRAQMQSQPNPICFFQVCNTRLVDAESKRMLVLSGTSKAFCLSSGHHIWALWSLIKGWIQTAAIASVEILTGNLPPLPSQLISSSLYALNMITFCTPQLNTIIIDLLIQKEGKKTIAYLHVWHPAYLFSSSRKQAQNGSVSQAPQTMCMNRELQQCCNQKCFLVLGRGFFCRVVFFFFFRSMVPFISPVQELSDCHR